MSSKQRSRLTNLATDLVNWMSNLPQQLKTTSITGISIPGSHDSFTANMTDSSDISPDAEEIVKELAQLGPLLKHVICNWSKTQTYMATEQLNRGIRYFDLRIATKENSNDLYICHSLYSDVVQPILNDINTFLNQHPKEVAILDCQHFYNFSSDTHNQLVSMLKSTFGDKLLPNSGNLNNITLDYMTNQNKYQVIVIYREDSIVGADKSFWPSSSFPNPWPNTTSQSYLFDYLTNGLSSRDPNLVFISQCVLTPDATFILENVLSTLEKKCAEDLEAPRSDWINKQSSGTKGLNVIIADFIELSDNKYPQDVVNLNLQLLDN